MQIIKSPVLPSCKVTDLFNTFKKHEPFCKSTIIPNLFIVWIDRRKGVAFGTTSTISHILTLSCSIGTCICLYLCSTWLFPNRNATRLARSFTRDRTDSGSRSRNVWRFSSPMTLRLAPVSMIAIPFVLNPSDWPALLVSPSSGTAVG